MIASEHAISGETGSGSGTASGTMPSTANTNLRSQAYLVPPFTGTVDVTLEHFHDCINCEWTPDETLIIAGIRLGGTGK
jgi:hypothetical protein